MIILGIETSCDETAAAVVQDGTKILSNVVASSAEIHAKTGGLIPERAARQQLKSMLPVIEQSLNQAFSKTETDLRKLLTEHIDAVAVTVGPGLIGSLLVGVETAKTLSCVTQKPIVPVNHLVAHIYANFLPAHEKNSENTPIFPALALVVSGGHTDMIMMKEHGKIEWLGGTRDDAAGEAFDKTARLLGFPYPGGPSLANAADKFLNNNQKTNKKELKMFPRPMIREKNYDWSFSGLKTSVLTKMKVIIAEDGVDSLQLSDYKKIQNNKKIKAQKDMLAAQIQEAIVDVLVKKSIDAIKEYKPKSFLLSGGVAANSRLRQTFRQQIEKENLPVAFFAPQPKLATDNAAVIASAAKFNYSPVPWSEIDANPNLSITDVV